MDLIQGKKIICCLKDSWVCVSGIIVAIIIASARISSFFISNWYYQGSDMKKWKGSLFRVYNSGGLIEKKTYPLLSEYYCAEKYSFSYSDSVNISYYDAEKMCSRFSGLTGGATAFMFFSILGLIFWIILIYILLTNRRSLKRLRCCIFISIFQFLCEFSCMICIAAPGSITFQDNCSYLSDNTSTSSNVNTCGDTGSIFSIMISIITFIYHICLYACFCVLRCCSSDYVDSEPEDRNQIEIQNRNDEAPRIEAEVLESQNKIVDYPD